MADKLISLNQVIVEKNNILSPGSALLLKAKLIDAVESNYGTFSGETHKVLFSTITVGLDSTNPKTFYIYESLSEIAKKMEEALQ